MRVFLCQAPSCKVLIKLSAALYDQAAKKLAAALWNEVVLFSTVFETIHTVGETVRTVAETLRTVAETIRTVAETLPTVSEGRVTKSV